MTKRTSPLRQRMIDDMTIRNMSLNTQKAYIRHDGLGRAIPIQEFSQSALDARPAHLLPVSPVP